MENLWLYDNGFTTFQALLHRLDVLPRDHVDEFAEFLPNFDLLTGVDGELEILWGLEDQDDGTTQTEPTHLLNRFQGLSIEERRGGGVHCFAVGSWRWEPSTFVRPEALQGWPP